MFGSHYAFIIFIFFKDCCYPFLFSFNLVLINYTEWSMIPACPSLMYSFNRGYIEGTNLKNLCLMFVCFVSVCMFCQFYIQIWCGQRFRLEALYSGYLEAEIRLTAQNPQLSYSYNHRLSLISHYLLHLLPWWLVLPWCDPLWLTED